MAMSPAASNAQGTSSGVVGWYNGDWRSGIPDLDNWYVTAQQYARVYDDFVVPDGGWTVTGVFANDMITSTGVTQASWEIRSGVSSGNPGTLVASGLSNATLTVIASLGGGEIEYQVAVNGLWLQLPAGQYWLSVTPVVTNGSYICVTLGANAVGNPPGNDSAAFYSATGVPGLSSHSFMPITSSGSGVTSGAVSLGVMITAPALPRLLAWQANLMSVTQQMETLHSLPFPGISLNDFETNVENLVDLVPALSDPEIRTGMQAIVASIGDPHTDVEWPSPSPFSYLPLNFYWFDDGIYITGAAPQYQDLLGGLVTSIDQASIQQAVGLLTPLVAHDNDSWLKYYLPATKLNNTDFLFGTGIALATDYVPVQVQNASGNTVTENVQAVSRVPGLLPVFQGTPPLYQQNPGRYYWSTVIDNGATVYFQYNSCTEDPANPSAAFLAQLNQTLAQPGVERLIVDMRNNTGGSATILDPWIEVIRAGRFNQKGHLYVIVGKATFSAAMEASDHFRDETAAIFVGEPTGGKPQFLLRRGDFGLPYFGLRASFSNGVEAANDPGPTLVPDIQTPVTFQNYMKGVDPAMDAILSTPAPAW